MGSGLKDWVTQRISAVILAVYVIFLVIYFVAHPQLSFSEWQTLFAHPLMKIFSTVVLLSLVAHAWIGAWTIFGDYLHCPVVRGCISVFVAIVLLLSFIWGLDIVWL